MDCLLNIAILCNVGDISLVFDTLLLYNDIQSLTMDIQGNKAFAGNFMEHTKQNYTNNISNAIGVEIRNFFIIYSELCEFKVEPLLTDYSKIFMQGIYNYKHVKIEDMEELINKSLKDYISKYEEIE